MPARPDPDVARLKEIDRVRGVHAYTDEERAIRDEGIAQLKRRLADRSDPEKNRMAGIMQALLAGSRGGPRNVGALAGFAEGSIAADRQQRLEREAAEKELQAVLATGRTERLATEAAATTAGQGVAQTTATREGNVLQSATVARGQTLSALTSMLEGQNRAAIAAADRVSREQIALADRAIQADRLALEKEIQRDSNADRNRIRIADGIRAVGDSVEKAYAPLLNTLSMQISMAGNDPKRAAAAQATYDATIREMNARIEQRSEPYRMLQPSSSLRFISAATPTR